MELPEATLILARARELCNEQDFSRSRRSRLMRSEGRACYPFGTHPHGPDCGSGSRIRPEIPKHRCRCKFGSSAELINIPVADRLTLPSLSAPGSGFGAASAFRARHGQRGRLRMSARSANGGAVPQVISAPIFLLHYLSRRTKRANFR